MSENILNKVEDDAVVSLNYTVMVNGEVVDTSDEHGPIQFIQGHGQVIKGLERELYGMEPGEDKTFVVAAADGYGEVDPDAYTDIPRTEFPDSIPMKEGITLILRGKDGEEIDAYIAKVSDESVRLNFNHPLAGKDLQFSVKIVSLRAATDEELAHGHIHEGDTHS